MESNRMSRIWHLATLWLAGSVAVGLVTWLCFRFAISAAATELASLLVIVFAAMLDSALTSVILSASALLWLDYFFAEPAFSLGVTSAHDLFTLMVFVITRW
jgi:K+-sensing histidine kinase KdpD